MSKVIVVVGDLKDKPAEGMEVITSKIYRELCAIFAHRVLSIKTKQLIKISFSSFFHKNPTFVFCHGPGVGVLIASILIRVFNRNSKTIYIASRPDLEGCPKWLLGLVKVDTIISAKYNEALKVVARNSKIEITKAFIGIDVERVGSTEYSEVPTIARKNGVPLLIHVGHIRKNRGLSKLINIKNTLGHSVEIAVIGSPSLSFDADVYEALIESGVSVYREHIALMGGVYKQADLYLFPVPGDGTGAVDLPLSVIEALACKTPVISTDFGLLESATNGVDGISIVPDEEFVPHVVSLVNSKAINGMDVGSLPIELDLKNLIKYI